jgi:tyrosyl-tRNA synthetase
MFRYYELLTDIPLHEIQELRADIASGKRHPMDAKADLSARIVSDYHGGAAAGAAREEFNRVFRKHQNPEDLETKKISIASGPMRLTRLLASLNLAPSNTEAQRLIESGAVHINDQRITDPKAEISQAGEFLFKVGKRRFLRLLVTQ